MIVVVVIIVIVVAYAVGRATWSSGTSTGRAGSNTDDFSSSGTSGTGTAAAQACKSACDQWDLRRAERCNLEKDEAAAKAMADSLRGQLNSVIASAIAAAASAAGAAAVATAIPFPPLKVAAFAVAAALMVVAAALWAYVFYLQGQLAAAENDLANKMQAAQAGRTAEANARAIMMSKCPEDEVQKCLNRPSPC